MLFPVSTWQTQAVDTAGKRLLKIIEDAVAQSNGRYSSPRDFFEKAELANSSASQTVKRLNAGATLTGKTLRNLAEALGLSQDTLYSMVHPPEVNKDERFPNRLIASFRAREIELSEDAIETVLSEKPQRDAPVRYWLERMLAEDTLSRSKRAL